MHENEKMVRKEFLIYDYYYTIPCHKCGKYNPALDFLEFSGTHPFQIGNLRPNEDIVIWFPSDKDEIESQEYPHKAWGLERVISFGRRLNLKRLDSLDEYTPKSTWDNIAPAWAPVSSQGGDYHHKYRILPEVYRMLDVQKDEKILDVACGEGNVSRHLTRNGAKVTGIDISKMIDYAIESEEKEKLGINYLKIDAEQIIEMFDEDSFDKVVCNMALMDIEDYKTTINQISKVLKENGIFVFSIIHPAFAWPTCTSIRIPEDSQRNEDKVRIVLDYFDERPVLIEKIFLFEDIYGPLLQFPRTISTYLNELVKNNLILKEMSEPKTSEELVEKFPSYTHLDDDIRPDFLIVKTMKKSDF
jgi:2-polyprenyl-3-methyl-5-hydroxy-6-metoxy-1,4-benzoquinol methylase